MSMPIFLALLAWSGIGLAAILLVAVVFAVMIRIENRAKRVAASLITECTYCTCGTDRGHGSTASSSHRARCRTRAPMGGRS